MTDAIQDTRNKLAKISKSLDQIDEVSEELRALVQVDSSLPSHAVRQAASIQILRDLFTSEVMAPVMALQNTPLGFKTDRPGGYDTDTVRDVMITAIGRGGQMTLNHTNIIAGNYYATKEQFGTWLDATQGRGNWLVIHGIPQVVRGEKMVKNKQTQQHTKIEGVIGAKITSEIRWLADGEWKSETLTHAIKGDDYATADAYNGKADRKCRAWLFGQITGQRVTDSDAEDAREVNLTPEGPQRGEPSDKFADLERKVAAAKAPEKAPEAPKPAPKAKAPAEPTPAPVTTDAEPDDLDMGEVDVSTVAKLAAIIGVRLSDLAQYCTATGLAPNSLADLTADDRQAMARNRVAVKAAVEAYLAE